MKKGIALWGLLAIGVGIYFYQTNSDFKTSFDNWLNGIQYDSLDGGSNLDTLSDRSQEGAKHKERERTPKRLKPDEFDSLDKYARNAPEKYSKSLQALATYLTTPAKNDLEKTRLIYTWIATHIRYDAEAYNSGIFRDEFSPDSVLKRRAAVCEGYSTLFKELALRMNLEVEKIVGYAKRYGVREADQFSETNHAWNVVKIQDKWQLIDVTWGSGYGFTNNGKLEAKVEFDAYWFCVAPEQFIFSHLPESEAWQLMDSKITLRQFEKLPYLDDSFFKLGFNAQDVYKHAISGAIKEFVTTYSSDFPIQTVNVPMNKLIVRGQEYSLVLQSNYVAEMVIIDDGQWVEFKKEGSRFSVNYIPQGDQLKIGVKINWYDKAFTTILEYEIDSTGI